MRGTCTVKSFNTCNVLDDKIFDFFILKVHIACPWIYIMDLNIYIYVQIACCYLKHINGEFLLSQP